MLVSAHFPPAEGMGFYIWNLARYLTHQGHQVDIITRGGARRTERQVEEGVTIWRPPFIPVYPFHVHFHALFVDRLLRYLETGLDLIHLHTPLVKHPRTQLPSLVTVHTPMRADVAATSADTVPGLLSKLQGPVSYRLEQELLTGVDKITVVASSVASELAAYGIIPSQVTVMGNGVDTSQFFPDRAGRDTRMPYVLTTVRLAPRKGLEDLIQCAQIVAEAYPSIRFLIAGRGPLEQLLCNEIERRKLKSHVVLLGQINDRQRLVELYRGAAIYLHPARYEGMPTALLEAMACGRAVVATAVSGALDVIEDGFNGLLATPRDPRQIAAAVMRLLSDPDLGDRLGAAAHDTILQRYSWEVVGLNYLYQYEALLAGASSAARA